MKMAGTVPPWSGSLDVEWYVTVLRTCWYAATDRTPSSLRMPVLSSKSAEIPVLPVSAVRTCPPALW
jgi:hypothetical protein